MHKEIALAAVVGLMSLNAWAQTGSPDRPSTAYLKDPGGNVLMYDRNGAVSLVGVADYNRLRLRRIDPATPDAFIACASPASCHFQAPPGALKPAPNPKVDNYGADPSSVYVPNLPGSQPAAQPMPQATSSCRDLLTCSDGMSFMIGKSDGPVPPGLNGLKVTGFGSQSVFLESPTPIDVPLFTTRRR
jgi:hypothetical protein